MTQTQRIEAIHRLGGEVPFDVRVCSAKDDRRNRDYHRDVYVVLEVPFANSEERALLPHPRAVADIARGLLKDQGIQVHRDINVAASACGARLTSFTGSDSAQWSPAHLSWCLRFTASSPSKIPNPALVEDWTREHLLPALSSAIATHLEQRRERVRREKAAKEATRIVSSASSETIDRAKKVVRYEQRLAALKAEMTAEIEEQARLIREKGEIEASCKGEGFEPEAVAYAVEHFVSRTIGWDSWVRSTHECRVEDLFPGGEEPSDV